MNRYHQTGVCLLHRFCKKCFFHVLIRFRQPSNAQKKYIAAVAAHVDQLVKENAVIAADQEKYSERYNSLVGEYEGLQRKREAVEKEKRARAEKREALETFYGELEELEVAFTPQRWNAIVEKVVVGINGEMKFLFVNRGEVTV